MCGIGIIEEFEATEEGAVSRADRDVSRLSRLQGYRAYMGLR